MLYLIKFETVAAWISHLNFSSFRQITLTHFQVKCTVCLFHHLGSSACGLILFEKNDIFVVNGGSSDHEPSPFFSLPFRVNHKNTVYDKKLRLHSLFFPIMKIQALPFNSSTYYLLMYI